MTIINTTYNTQSTEHYKADISKYIFSISISLILKYQYSFIEYAVFESCFAAFLFGLRISSLFTGL